MIGRRVICSNCGQEAICRSVLDVQHAPRRVFCDDACMVLFVREQYIEVTSAARVTATPAEAPGPPSGRVSVGIGGDPVSAARGSAAGAGSPPTIYAPFLRALRALRA